MAEQTTKGINRYSFTDEFIAKIKKHLDDGSKYLPFIRRYKPKEKKDGTVLFMSIGLDSKRKLQNVFIEATEKNPEGIPRFNKTKFLVKLSKLGDERYVSRSQARRIVLGLEKFKHVVLDFKGISTVGQGFVDEVFRVFKSKHPGIEIIYTNANDDVKFMIERSLPPLY